MAEIKEILQRYWGYENFRSLQEEIILSVIGGKDTLALMPTGGGKSITYQVAGLAQEGICVVITPLIALMKDQVEDLNIRGIPAEAIYTGMSFEKIDSVINKCIYRKVKFLYVSPERLTSEIFRIKLREMNVCLLTVDEAHCISQWGYDFRPSYLKIAEIRSYFPCTPVLALTATATPEVVKDIQQQLKFRESHVLSKSFRRPNISYVVREGNDKLGELIHILSRIRACAIVYVRKRDTAAEIARFLNKRGIKADFYHAGLSSPERSLRQENWKKDTVPVIVATNAFGMGIDKPDVRAVIHFDIPDSPEAYFQEAGRAGRDGQKAYAVLLYNPASLAAMKARITKGFPPKSYIKRVYEALGNFFQIAEGSGNGFAFEFDMDTFVKNFQLEYAETVSALKILQTGGYIEWTDGVNSRSRILFTVSREKLNKVVFEEEFEEHLVVFLLRNYAGIFAQYVFFNEQYVADVMETDRRVVYQTLIGLAKRKIVSYIPGDERPYIVYHQPRLPLSYLSLSKEVYEDRKGVYRRRVGSMVEYIKEAGRCRQLFLMRYFGQKEKEPCGICDLCLERKKGFRQSGRKEAGQKIKEWLKEQDIPLKELVARFEGERETALEVIRELLDEGEIYYKAPFILALKK